MRRAVIDIGTNSIKCIIAEHSADGLCILEETVIISRLGEGLQETGFISPMAFSENMKALGQIQQMCIDKGVQEIRALGTMALRSAANADEFVGVARRELGIQINVISGAEEARLSFLGAISSFEDVPDEVLVFDTGGGSTELIHATAFEIDKCLSISLGAHLLKHKFGSQDPIPDTIYSALEHFTQTQLRPYLADYARVPSIIGIGGTPVSLAAVKLKQTDFDPASINGLSLSRTDLDAQIELYRSMKDVDRKQIVGLPPQRSDLILFGAVIVKTILLLCEQQSIRVSAAGLRHGAMMD